MGSNANTSLPPFPAHPHHRPVLLCSNPALLSAPAETEPRYRPLPDPLRPATPPSRPQPAGAAWGRGTTLPLHRTSPSPSPRPPGPGPEGRRRRGGAKGSTAPAPRPLPPGSVPPGRPPRPARRPAAPPAPLPPPAPLLALSASAAQTFLRARLRAAAACPPARPPAPGPWAPRRRGPDPRAGSPGQAMAARAPPAAPAAEEPGGPGGPPRRKKSRSGVSGLRRAFSWLRGKRRKKAAGTEGAEPAAPRAKKADDKARRAKGKGRGKATGHLGRRRAAPRVRPGWLLWGSAACRRWWLPRRRCLGSEEPRAQPRSRWRGPPEGGRNPLA